MQSVHSAQRHALYREYFVSNTCRMKLYKLHVFIRQSCSAHHGCAVACARMSGGAREVRTTITTAKQINITIIYLFIYLLKLYLITLTPSAIADFQGGRANKKKTIYINTNKDSKQVQLHRTHEHCLSHDYDYLGH